MTGRRREERERNWTDVAVGAAIIAVVLTALVVGVVAVLR